MTMIDIRELPARLDELLSLAKDGSEVTLTDGVNCLARIVPCTKKSKNGLRIPDLHPGAMEMAPTSTIPAEFFLVGRIMKLLLDTHAFIWWDGQSRRLSPEAFAAIQDKSNKLMLSAASAWEIAIKTGVGKMTLRRPLSVLIAHQRTSGLRFLPIQLKHIMEVEKLPHAHRYPFDRMLAAKAIVEGAHLVTADPVFAS